MNRSQASLKCAAARGGFVSFHILRSRMFHNARQRIISHSTQGEYFTVKQRIQQKGQAAPMGNSLLFFWNVAFFPCSEGRTREPAPFSLITAPGEPEVRQVGNPGILTLNLGFPTTLVFPKPGCALESMGSCILSPGDPKPASGGAQASVFLKLPQRL